MRCLEALLALDYPRYEVLILDNESSDGTAEACRGLAAGAAVPVRVETMGGSVGRLRNASAELSDADVLAFTDSDCMPAAGWLAAGVGPFADAGVGVVQGKTLPEPGVARTPWDATIEVTSYSGRFESCNLLVRREAFAAATGFDERVGHFWEDTAAGWSMLLQGWRPAFASGAVVYHDVTRPGFGWWLRRAQRYGNVASVVRERPELRAELLWGRYFMLSRNAKTVGLVLGVAVAPLDRRALLLALPYLWFRRPAGLAPGHLLHGVAEPTLFDLAVLAGMVRGSIEHRTLVL